MVRTCQNCGTAVSVRYVRVFCPDGVEHPQCCPACPDKTRRGGRTEIIETKQKRATARAVE